MSNRPDKFPTVLLIDTINVQAHVQKIREESGFEASVYDRKASYGLEIFPNHRVSHKTLARLLAANPEIARRVDLSILFKLSLMLRKSKALPEIDYETMELIMKKNAKLVYKLTVLGCRVRFKTQQELANRLGCSRSHLNEQIGLLSELMIIVNKGHGFVDLNPNVYWYGRMEHQIAYCSQHCRLVWRARDLPSLLCPWPLHDFPDIDGPIFFSWDDWEDDET